MRHAAAAAATRIACTRAAALVVVLALLPLVLGLFFAGVDVDRVDVPYQVEMRALLARGHGLFIAPSFGQGAPLLTSPLAQLLYPSRIFTLAFAPELGVHLHIVAHLALMAAGMAWLARTFALGVAASAAAGVALAASGVTLDLVTHSTYLVGGAWLPVVWASARRLPRRPDAARGFALLTLALAALLLGGEPHAFAIGAALVVVEVARRARRQGSRAASHAALAGLAIALAGGVGAALWIPALVEQSLSGRAGAALPMSTVLARSFSPSEWPALVWPALLTDVGQGMQTFRALVGDDPTRRIWNQTPYVGALALVCVALGATIRRTRVALAVVVFAFVLALGEHGLVLPALVELVPPVGLFRFPAKYLVVANVALHVVVAATLAHATRRPRWRRRVVAGAASVVALHVVALVALTFAREAIDAVPTPMPPGGIGAARPPLSSLLTARVAQAGVLALVALGLSWRAPARVVSILVALELVVLAPSHVVLRPAFSDEPSPLRALATRDTPFVRPLCAEPHAVVVARHFDGSTDETESARRNARFGVSEMQVFHGFSSTHDYAPAAPRVAVALTEALEERPHLARALGCTVFLTAHAETPDGMRAMSLVDENGREQARVDGVRVLAVDAPIPDFGVVRARVVVDDEEALMAALHDGHDPLSLVDDPAHALEARSTKQGGALPDGAGVTGVALDVENPHRVTLKADGAGGAVLLARTSFRRGWMATQGGTPLPVVRVGGMFTAVVVDDVARGPVTLTYAPPRFSLGLALAVACLVVATVLAEWLRRRETPVPDR